jgi:4-diphosphocytidyl-2-C-methyl-D-erythritol kinase
MQNRFGNSRMSGSGSTVFAWMDDHPLSRTGHPPTFSASELGLNELEWVGRVVRGLTQHPLLDVLDPLA